MIKKRIEVEHLSKKYNKEGFRAYLTLRENIYLFFKNIFPQSLSGKKEKDKKSFYALNNVSFTVKEGEVLGVIGANGAGKSTLLKILSRITYPTNGKVIIHGRVASLLEVGTGFHQELTGMENIYLNGAILGMTRKEIQVKLKKIIDFSGVERFINTPVKHYSTGMRLRLAFAIAAHLEPEILLIDEVLAVGDISFQKKCLKTMGDITQKGKRTIIFVSHDLSSINKLCNRCIWLDNGKIKKIGKTNNVINQYLSSQADLVKQKKTISFKDDINKRSKILKITIKNHKKEITNQLDMAHPFYIEAKVRNSDPNTRMFLGISSTFNNKYILQSYLGDCVEKETRLDLGTSIVTIKINPILNEGNYSFKLATSTLGKAVDVVSQEISFSINNLSGLPYKSTANSCPHSLVVFPAHWKIKNINSKNK